MLTDEVECHVQLPVASWLPGETLYSLAARYHRLSGNRRHDATCSALFGHSRIGLAHDFPARVNEFCERTRGALGDARAIVVMRSILPIFWRFRTAADRENAIAGASGTGLGQLKARLGILASRFGAAHPLKLCPVCVRQDWERFHVAYWHVEHQWPGVWICEAHQCGLERALDKVNGAGRFSWLLPDEVQSMRLQFAEPGSQCWQTLGRLAGITNSLGRQPYDHHLRPRVLAEAFCRRLSQLGVLGRSNRSDIGTFTQVLRQSLSPIAHISGFEVLTESSTSMAGQFLRLLKPRSSVAHPLRYLLLGTALFQSWQDLSDAYDNALKEGRSVDWAQSPPAASPSNRSTEFRKSQVIAWIESGNSATAAARAAGVSVATAIAWAAANGHGSKRRPKKLNDDRRAWAIARLKRGAGKVAVAKAIEMSVETVTTLLRTEPGLHEVWKDVRAARALAIARRRWARAAQSIPSPTLKTMRQTQPAVFAWLYRNDRAWLQDFNCGLAEARREPRGHVRWDLRDADLARLIHLTALDLAERQPLKRIRIADLCNAIDSLKRRLSDLPRLPLTRAALRQLVGRQRGNAHGFPGKD